MNKFNDLKLYRGATSVIELDFTGFDFAENSKCQLTIEKKYNNDVIYQYDFDKPIKYYITFKDEFTANLDDDKYKYDIMYMLNDERYPQCEISDIYMEEVINNYNGEVNPDAVEVTEVLTVGAEISDSIKINNSNVVIINSRLQELSISPTKEEQVITPNEEYDGFSKVTIDPIPNEYIIPTGTLDIKTNGTHDVTEKSSVNVDVQPSLQDKKVIVKPNDNTYIMPDEDYYGLALVNVIGAVDTENVEVTPTKEVQTINRSEDKYIESVKVNAIPDEYIIPSGELEITANGQYDVTDKASVNVETSGADLTEYFGGTIVGTTSSMGITWQNGVKKLPALTNSGTMQYLYNNFKGTEIDVSKLDFTKTTTMQSMFQNCSNLTKLDLSKFDTSKVTNMSYMFEGCSGLTSLDLSNFNTSNVTNMSQMLRNCSKIENLNLSSFNTTNVTNMSQMLSGCRGLKSINLSHFNTTKVTNMASMFANDVNLESVDLSNLDTSNVTDISALFYMCDKLKSVNFEGWTTPKLTTITRMFFSCFSIQSLNLTGISTSNVTNMADIFNNCTKLTHLDIRDFDFTNVTSYSNMFGQSVSNGVPNDCLIIVKDETAKEWITSKFSRLTNVKTVAEYEAQ